MDYYVSMVEPEGRRRMSLLDGPFKSEAEARTALPAASRWASAIDPWCDFNSFGVVGTTAAVPTPMMRRK